MYYYQQADWPSGKKEKMFKILFTVFHVTIFLYIRGNRMELNKNMQGTNNAIKLNAIFLSACCMLVMIHYCGI